MSDLITVRVTPAAAGRGATIEVDLGGDLDEGCCGCEAAALHEALARRGVDLRLAKVGCRLPVEERVAAKAAGKCRWRVANPIAQDGSYARERIES